MESICNLYFQIYILSFSLLFNFIFQYPNNIKNNWENLYTDNPIILSTLNMLILQCLHCTNSIKDYFCVRLVLAQTARTIPNSPGKLTNVLEIDIRALNMVVLCQFWSFLHFLFYWGVIEFLQTFNKYLKILNHRGRSSGSAVGLLPCM